MAKMRAAKGRYVVFIGENKGDKELYDSTFHIVDNAKARTTFCGEIFVPSQDNFSTKKPTSYQGTKLRLCTFCGDHVPEKKAKKAVAKKKK